MSAKILLLDLETAPILMAAWRQWDTSAVYVMRNTYILMYAFQWLHEGKTICRALPDYDTYEADKHSDRTLCWELRELLDEADVVVAEGRAANCESIHEVRRASQSLRLLICAS